MNRADLPISPTRGRRTIVIPILVVLLLSPFLIGAKGGPGGGRGDTTVSGGTGVTVGDNSGNGYHHWSDAGNSWVGGALNKSKGTYREGTPVPYRLVLTDLPAGSHALVGEYQYAKLQKNAWAFAGISGYGTRTVDAPPCDGCTALAGSPEVFGGSDVTLDDTTVVDGQYRRFTITFTTATAGTVVVAWGGLLDVPHDGRLGPAGIAGASYHMKLVSLDGSNLGSMDLQLQASAVLSVDDPEPDGDGGCPDGAELSEDGTTCVTPPPACEGSITAAMVDGNDNPVAGGSLSGTPTVALNGDATDVTCDPVTTDPTHSYTASAPAGWQFVSGTTNPKTARIDTDGDSVTLTWVVEPIPCTGTITATMVDGSGNPVTGSLTASHDAPTVTLNGDATAVTCDPVTTDPTHSYTASAPAGWQLVSGTTNPKTARIDTDGDTVTLTWTVRPVLVVPDPDPIITPDPVTDPVFDTDPVTDPVVEDDPVTDPVFDTDPVTDPVVEDDPFTDPVFDTDPVTDPVVEDDPATGGGSETCAGDLSVQVVDLLGDVVPGAHVALDGQDREVSTDGLEVTDLDCGTLEVELTSVPDGYVFVRTEIDGAGTFSAQSAHKRRKVTATVSDDTTTTVVFVIDPLEVMPEEITEPAPERDPLGAPEPTSDQPDPAPQPAPGEPAVEPVADRTLPRTGIPGGRLPALAILLVAAGSAVLGSRRSVDR